MIWNAAITKQNKKSKSNKKKQTNKQTNHARTHAWTWRWCITQKIIITRKRTGEPHKQSHKKACEQASTHTQKMTRRPQGPIYGVKQQQEQEPRPGHDRATMALLVCNRFSPPGWERLLKIRDRPVQRNMTSPLPPVMPGLVFIDHFFLGIF